MKRNLLKFLFIVILSVSGSAAGVGASTPRNPILSLPKAVQQHFACIVWRESRSTLAHPNLLDNNGNGGASGVFQFEPILWNRWAPSAGVHVPVWKASYYQQSLVAVNVWRHDGFSPWRDGC